MNEIIYPTKQEWLTALRSSEYEQIVGGLHDDGNGFCTLGVYLDLMVAANGGKWAMELFPMIVLPQAPNTMGASRVPITTKSRNMIIELNDGKKMSFERIADYIENKVPVYSSVKEAELNE